ncbi:MAG TPA: hypothetical protein VHC63_05535 [Acidimicrobiales bacterium]|nr:hypothetical protein [Acidimicrobiales bacterium]
MRSRRRTQVISVLLGVTIFVFGGPRLTPLHAAKSKVQIGTACVMERTPTGNVQTCR